MLVNCTTSNSETLQHLHRIQTSDRGHQVVWIASSAHQIQILNLVWLQSDQLSQGPTEAGPQVVISNGYAIDTWIGEACHDNRCCKSIYNLIVPQFNFLNTREEGDDACNCLGCAFIQLVVLDG